MSVYNPPIKRQRKSSESSGTLSVPDGEQYQDCLKDDEIVKSDFDHDYSLPPAIMNNKSYGLTLTTAGDNSSGVKLSLRQEDLQQLVNHLSVRQGKDLESSIPRVKQVVMPVMADNTEVGSNSKSTGLFLLPVMNADNKIVVDNVALEVDNTAFCQTIQTSNNLRLTNSPWQQYVQQFKRMGPCPVCGDKISGYHYGIFCCESCKGFFKRTVQGSKSYVCHRGPNQSSNCDVNLTSRKKCPACRYDKCKLVGMRAEAIRADRTRGGRSVYPGSRSRQLSDQNTTCSTVAPPYKLSPSADILSIAASESLSQSDLNLPIMTEDCTSNSVKLQLPVSVSPAPDPKPPALHKLVREALQVEQVVACEEDTLELGEVADERAVYKALLLLADQRLYRLVRWSRQLPAFSAASTEDQILLLQNCWADLLCLDCCWRSMATPQEIRLTSNKCINLEAARELGAQEIVNKILVLTQELHRLRLDQTEYAGLKVILLMQPDVPNLRDNKNVQKYQNEMCGALMQYTLNTYPEEPNKFAELFLKLPDLKRISSLARDILVDKDLSGFLSPQSLLMELLVKSVVTRNNMSRANNTTQSSIVVSTVGDTKNDPSLNSSSYSSASGNIMGAFM